MGSEQLGRPRRRGRAGTWLTVRAAAAAWLVCTASAAWSLGLGDIETNSALNERFAARIELIEAQGLQRDEIIVTLASAEDYARVGVERFFFLTDLRFDVVVGPRGTTHIAVTSTQPITEPYLNFLVEVLWPRGRMLKEYTVLLDPPTFSPTAAAPVTAPSIARGDDRSAGQVERQPVPQSAPASGTRVQLGAAARSPSPLDEGVVDGQYRMTDRNDTLWSIASRTRPSARVSVQQNMLAIQRLNPEAFLSGNINLLKAGYSLRLPSESEALLIGNAEANQLVAIQNEDWRALRRGEPVPDRGAAEQLAAADPGSATPLRTQVDATPAPAPREVAPTRQDGELRIVAGTGEGITSGGGGAAPQSVLEEQDRLNREVEQLTEALDREKELASDQIAVKDRQIEVRDQQLAELQAQLERMRQDMDQALAAAQTQNQSASAAPQPWWQSPYVLLGAAGFVVLLLVLAMAASRRRRAADDDFFDADVEHAATAAATPTVAAASRGGVAWAAAAADDGEGGLAEELEGLEFEPGQATAADAAGGAGDVQSGAAEAGDVIGEADIYVAYGRYPQAIALLSGVLDEDPTRNDVRLKLLELHAETREREAFDEHMTALIAHCDDEEALLSARELALQFGDDGAAASVEADDLGLDLAHEAAGAPGVGIDSNGSETGVEFELELDDQGEAPRAEHSVDTLGGDLGIDFDPDRSEDATSTDGLELDLEDAEALSDEAFDFGDEGDTASTKLDLARAYIDMGDQDGARDILNEVVEEGNTEQQKRAQAMLEEL
jgi:pilus assembly protein FimV